MPGIGHYGRSSLACECLKKLSGHQPWLSFISIPSYISQTILGGTDLWDEFVDAIAICLVFFPLNLYIFVLPLFYFFCFVADSTNSSENIYTMMNPIGPGGNRPNVSASAKTGLGFKKALFLNDLESFGTSCGVNLRPGRRETHHVC